MVYYKVRQKCTGAKGAVEVGFMPIYDFKCDKCNHRFELFTSISRRSQAVCPRCGGPVSRVYEGKWSMGVKPSAGANGGGCSCGGNCAGCAGCGK